MRDYVHPSGVAMPRVLENPTLQQARNEAFDSVWVASFLAVGVAIGFGRYAYCVYKRNERSKP